MSYAVYLLASKPYGTLYVGVTSDLVKRVAEHRSEAFGGFTARYGVKRLVWYETHNDVHAAITREKWIKRWHRIWKIALMEEENHHWDDLYPGLLGMTPNQLAAWDERFPA